MKEFLNETLVLNKNIEEKRSLMKDHISDRVFNQVLKEKKKKIIFFELPTRIRKEKNITDFTSLERISIVVDGLIGDLSKAEICRKEKISSESYDELKQEFLGAFNEFSEFKELQETLTIHNKELILKALGEGHFDFYQKFTDVTAYDSLVVPKEKDLLNYSSEYIKVKTIVLLDKINNFRQINKKFEDANDKLPMGGLFMGSFETFNSRVRKARFCNVPILKHVCSSMGFLVHRVFPKLPYVKKGYFFLTKGKNRLLSKAEALGRLVSCGFDILDYTEIDGIHYFASIKIKEPSYDMNPSYGPLFKMQRVGKNGKMIGVYKFRTMHPYSEYLQDYILKLNGYAETGKPANDFRLVPWGKFLRRYWLDELPQLINLFKGELKLVGARPVSKTYFKDIPEDIQKLRLTQKPGCIPPYVALNARSTVKDVLGAEKEYLQEKIKNPYSTDTKYFFNAIYNILFRGKRSA
jgi:lipopolysaccharide/colanic/teichoic acid biosynthesis glycosyltransferase